MIPSASSLWPPEEASSSTINTHDTDNTASPEQIPFELLEMDTDDAEDLDVLNTRNFPNNATTHDADLPPHVLERVLWNRNLQQALADSIRSASALDPPPTDQCDRSPVSTTQEPWMLDLVEDHIAHARQTALQEIHTITSTSTQEADLTALQAECETRLQGVIGPANRQSVAQNLLTTISSPQLRTRFWTTWLKRARDEKLQTLLEEREAMQHEHGARALARMPIRREWERRRDDLLTGLSAEEKVSIEQAWKRKCEAVRAERERCRAAGLADPYPRRVVGAERVDLPAGWEMLYSRIGEPCFIDHSTGKTAWEIPTRREVGTGLRKPASNPMHLHQTEIPVTGSEEEQERRSARILTATQAIEVALAGMTCTRERWRIAQAVVDACPVAERNLVVRAWNGRKAEKKARRDREKLEGGLQTRGVLRVGGKGNGRVRFVDVDGAGGGDGREGGGDVREGGRRHAEGLEGGWLCDG